MRNNPQSHWIWPADMGFCYQKLGAVQDTRLQPIFDQDFFANSDAEFRDSFNSFTDYPFVRQIKMQSHFPVIIHSLLSR